MAIITEEQETSEPQQVRQRRKSTAKPEAETPSPSPPRRKPAPSTANPFHFWFYFTILASAITLVAVAISSLASKDPRTWFLSLPPNLRQHYSDGRRLKVQITPNHPQVEVFSTQKGSTNADGHVLILHGMGSNSFAFREVVEHLGSNNVHAVAIDLPGSGFSDRSVTVDEEYVASGLAALWDVYEEIKEKGIFWGFDQLVEQGYVNFEENEAKIKTRKIAKTVELGIEEMDRVLGQVIDTMGLNPVDLVLHDTALPLSSNWILKNHRNVRSIVILDAYPGETALPLWVLRTPLLRELVLGFGFAFAKVLRSCCMDVDGSTEMEAHRVLLKGRDNGRAIVEMGKNLNRSFDLSEWGSCDGVKDLPVQVLFSDEMIEEGKRIADALPRATLATHSGGRWIQEKNSKEVAESILKFVSSLPKSPKQAVERETILDEL